MKTKEKEQEVYDIIKTLDERVGIGIKKLGFTQTQVMRALERFYPFVKGKNYYFQRAEIYGKVREDIDLISFFQGVSTKITKAHITRCFLKKGYSGKWILQNLGKEYYWYIYLDRNRRYERIRAKEGRKIIEKLKNFGSNKKVNIDFIIKTIKSGKSLRSGKRKLRDFTTIGNAYDHLKRYGLTFNDIWEKEEKELVEMVVKFYLKKKIIVEDYEGFLKSLYDQIPLQYLDKFSGKNKKGIVKSFLKTRLLTRNTIDKMIIDSKDFNDFKEKFEKYIYNWINDTHYTGNNKIDEKNKAKKQIKEKIKERNIKTISEFIDTCLKEGYTIAIRKVDKKARKKIYRFIWKFGKTEDFKKVLKIKKCEIYY